MVRDENPTRAANKKSPILVIFYKKKLLWNSGIIIVIKNTAMSEKYEPNQEFENFFLDQELGAGATEFIRKTTQEAIERRFKFAAEGSFKTGGYDDPNVKKRVEENQLRTVNHEVETAGRLAGYYKTIFGSSVLSTEREAEIEKVWEQICDRHKVWFTREETFPVSIAEDFVQYFILTGKKKWSADEETKIIQALDKNVSDKLTCAISYESIKNDTLGLGEGLQRSELLEAAESEAYRDVLKGKTGCSPQEVNMMVANLKNRFIDYRSGLDNLTSEGWKAMHKEECLRFAAVFTILKRSIQKPN
jgi:hypothetical protein